MTFWSVHRVGVSETLSGGCMNSVGVRCFLEGEGVGVTEALSGGCTFIKYE